VRSGPMDSEGGGSVGGGGSGLSECASVILDFLQSKCLFAVERALRLELELGADSLLAPDVDNGKIANRNLWTSKLEQLLDVAVPLSAPLDDPRHVQDISDLTPNRASPTQLDVAEENIAAGNCVNLSKALPQKQKRRPKLYELRSDPKRENEETYRKRRSRDHMSRVVFHDPPPMSSDKSRKLAHISLPVLYNPYVNGLEDNADLPLDVGSVLVERYRVVAVIGKGSFSRVVQAFDLKDKVMVSIKVLRNEKDCLDQGIGEIRILSLLAQNDALGAQPILRMLDYFYFKEHLLIVTELLRDSLFNFYRYLLASDAPDGIASYFTLPTIAKLSYQMLSALSYIHELGMCHCDIKPENICMVSASRCKFKLIDFGSATLQFDCHNSYVQSRWYRAPEVMLGLPWDQKIDCWSFGCVLVELMVGRPIFYGPSVEHVLAAQIALLGSIPERLMRASSLARLYFTADRELYTVDPQGHPEGVYLVSPVRTSLRDLVSHDDAQYLDFVESLLQFDPERRLSAADALQHPWLTAMIEQADREAIEDDMRARFSVTSSLHGYCASPGNLSPCGSPLNSEPQSRDFSQQPSREGSRDVSRDVTPPRERAAREAGTFSGAPSAADVGSFKRSSKPTSKRRGSDATDGPGVPEDFRNQLAADGSRTTGSEWRQRIARMLTPAGSNSRKVEEMPASLMSDAGMLGDVSLAPPGSAPHRPKKRL